MKKKNAPAGCKCCGCLLFEMSSLFAESDTLVVNGWTVIDRSLPLGGHYALSTSLTFRGLVPEHYRIEFALLKDDNSVFANWFYDGAFEYLEVPEDYGLDPDTNVFVPRGPTHVLNADFEIAWPENVIATDIAERNWTFNVPPDESETGGTMDDATDRITGSHLLFNEQLAVRPSAGLLLFNTPETSPLHLNGRIGSSVFQSSPLPLDESTLEDAGPLRFAAKLVNGWHGLPGQNAAASSPVTASKTFTVNSQAEEIASESQTVSKTLTIDDTPIVYTPVNTPRIVLDVPFGDGLITEEDNQSFGNITGRAYHIASRTSGGFFKIAGVQSFGFISDDGTFLVVIPSGARPLFPTAGFVTIEVETAPSSGTYVSTDIYVYKRPDHFAIVFVEDRDNNDTLTANESLIQSGSNQLNVRIDLPSATFAGDELTINGQSTVLTSSDITARRVLKTFPKPANGGTLAVNATLKRYLPEIKINPMFAAFVDSDDRVPVDHVGDFAISGTTKRVKAGRPIAVDIASVTTLNTTTNSGGTWSVTVNNATLQTLPENSLITATIIDEDDNQASSTRLLVNQPASLQVVITDDANDYDDNLYPGDYVDNQVRVRVDLPENIVLEGDAIKLSATGINDRFITIGETEVDQGFVVASIPATEGETSVTATVYTGSFDLYVRGERVLVEGIEDGTGAYGGDPCKGQEERNPLCIHPVACPVTFPNYASPHWSEASVSGFPASTLGTSIGSPQACRTSFNRPQDGTNPTSDEILNYNIFNRDGSGVRDGPKPTFPQSGFAYSWDCRVLADVDPCYWLVRLSLNISAWTISPGADPPYHAPNVPLYPFQNRQGTISQPLFGYNNSIAATFEKRLHRWDGPPPAIAFSSADMVEDPVTWKLLNDYEFSDADPYGPATFLLTDLTTSALGVSIAPSSATTIPHP